MCTYIYIFKKKYWASLLSVNAPDFYAHDTPKNNTNFCSPSANLLEVGLPLNLGGTLFLIHYLSIFIAKRSNDSGVACVRSLYTVISQQRGTDVTAGTFSLCPCYFINN